MQQYRRTMMNEEIFRKKSLDKVKSPENLDDYIQVSNPKIWLILVSAIILLVGAVVWGTYGHIDSTVPATVRVDNGSIACYVSEEDISSIEAGFTVEFSKNEAEIISIGEKQELGYACQLKGNVDLKNGVYEGKVVIKSYKPLSFVLN